MRLLIHILAQATTAAAPAAPAAPPAPVAAPVAPLITLDTIFWMTVLVIFLVTILSALLRRLAKDKALKLFHEYHVAFFSERRGTLWGDCLVSSQGLELLFDKAFITRRQIVKSSALIYEEEFVPMICLTRTIHGLKAHELRDRAAQIQRTFRPTRVHRVRRWFRNMLNTMRDAITKTMNLVIGRISGAGLAGAALTTQAGDIGNLTGTFVGLAANAYEPLLERYIGQPVVVEINLPPPPGPPPPPNAVPDTAEFPGYLVDYTQKFIAVFNVDHTPVETLELRLEAGKPPSPEIPELKITTTSQDTIIRCEGKDAFVLRTLTAAGNVTDLGIAMIPGTSVLLAPVEQATLVVERTRQIDLIVPRTRGRIRFGSLPTRAAGDGERNWLGVAPVTDSREFLHALRERAHTMSLFSHLKGNDTSASDGMISQMKDGTPRDP